MGVAPVTETDGYEGTLLDPNWAEVRGIYRGLWFWSDEMVAYYADQLRWQEIDAEIKANLPPWARQALGWE
jgi:hypothetical protein